MRNKELKFVGRWAKIHNKRELSLVNILNSQMSDIFEYWTTDEHWRENFETKRSQHYWFTELYGTTSAMFFLGMIEKPISSVCIFEAIEKAVKFYDDCMKEV